MPKGRYSLHDPHDHTPLAEEHFHCAPGPHGWRYVAQLTTPTPENDHLGSVDLTLDDLGRPLRLELHSGGWQVRGGALEGVTWVRTDPTGQEATEGTVAAHAFTGNSPAFLVATARLLRLTTTSPPTRVRLVSFTGQALAPRTLDQQWALRSSETHATDNGPLTVDEYLVGEVETGEQHTVHLAGDVILSAPGIELEDLETPPTRFTD
ncbi:MULTISPECIES: hypothetical protein [Streptomyces]|uniref:Uncharacterized protein n=1 Tax=Streptomyces odorifer TaxID=53450 RepID=A0A7Y6C666_9ACTN|nr:MULTISPECIES: hypothetical protein [Streptomyces]NUV33202.1 hypothetical protein [Streptomyces sp. KAI-27]NUV48383.1 hypothetical protein [Streptomyces sp. CAI-78]MBL0779577.1 hypothetical protein [Streptomyces albidoflavus]MBV1954556.1 hypothetical protein [Streptomyces sp. BV333]MCR0990772.1 hypothetical protein [Streptomyces albidoflavus]